MRALVHIVQMVDRPDDLAPFLRQLGRDHRKFGVAPRHYEAVGTALLASLKNHLGREWTPQVERAWAEAFTIAARAMQDAAAADQNPPSWHATVVEHRRLTWDLALVRLVPDQLVPYHPGQYMSVEVPQRPRLWRYLSPANAPREDGGIEFHVRAVDGGWVSRAIVSHTQPGDVWRLGPPLGRLAVDREAARNVLMIAAWAPASRRCARSSTTSRCGARTPRCASSTAARPARTSTTSKNCVRSPPSTPG